MADAPPLRFAEVRTVVCGLTATRLGFQQLFEAALADSTVAKDRALPRNFLHALYLGAKQAAADGAAFDRADVKDAAALALTAVGHRDAVSAILIAAVANGLFDPPGADTAGIARARDKATVAIGTVEDLCSTARLQSGLQSLTHTFSTFPDPGRLITAILLAQKRLCRVEVRRANQKPVSGTGFLIGPSTVLTNWHVVGDVSDPLGDDRVTVLFDFSQLTGEPTSDTGRFAVQGSWKVKVSEPGDLAPADAPAGWWMTRSTRDSWASALAGHLDFAVIRLQGAPGLQRGFYDLALVDRSAGAETAECVVFHHPGGGGASVNPGVINFACDSRLFHSASTIRGSSGGLVMDMESRAIGLHYLGLGPEIPPEDFAKATPDRVVNVAVSLSAIAAALTGELDAIRKPQGPVLLRGSLDDGHPVFGRRLLLAQLDQMARGDKRFLWVQPPPGSVRRAGKSFTTSILKSLFPMPGNLYIELASDQIPVNARDLVALLLSKISGSAARELPEADTGETAYDKVLFDTLREIVASRWAGNLIWLVIDDLDIHDLTDAGGRNFLKRLYHDIRDIPQLRIVLIGLKVALTEIPDELLLRHPIDIPDREQLVQQFEDWLLERGARDTPIGPATAILKDMARAHIGPDTPVEDLARFTKSVILPALKPFFGEAR